MASCSPAYSCSFVQIRGWLFRHGKVGMELSYIGGKIRNMSVETQELGSICEQLPDAKRAEGAQFARFLLARQGDERWEQIIAETKPRPKLEAFLKESATEGSEP